MIKLKNKIIVVTMSLMMLTPTVVGASGTNVDRISGSNRVLTSEKVSKRVYRESNEVVVTGYKGIADALTGTLLASEKDAPMIIINKYDEEFDNELKRLGVDKVTILGGSTVISKEVEEAIRSGGYQVERVAGRNRVVTAVDVMGKSKEKGDHVYITNDGLSGSLADALAIGPVSGRDKKPILLTSTTKLPKETKDALRKHKIKKATVIGGTTAVSNNVVRELQKEGIKVDRVSGTNRYETAVKVSDKYFKNSKSAIVTNGGNVSLADALLAGYLGAKENSPIVITNNNNLSKETREHIEKTKDKIVVVGGTSVVGKGVENQLKEMLKSEGGGGVIPPIEETTPPKEEVTPPVEEIAPPKEDTTPPNEEITPPKEEVTPPKEEITPPKEEEEEEEEIEVVGIRVDSKEELNDVITKLAKTRTNEGIRMTYFGGDDNTLKEIVEEIKNRSKASTTYDESNIENVVGSMSRLDKQGVSYIYLELLYWTTPEEEMFITKEVERISGEIINSGMSEFEKVKVLHDYVVDNVTYGGNTVASNQGAYAALKEGRAVCGGYGKTYSRLLEHNGIESMYVAGKTTGGGDHGWNKVKVDGVWYNVDPTRNIRSNKKELRYKYFLKSDKVFYGYQVPDHKERLPRSLDTRYDNLYGNE